VLGPSCSGQTAAAQVVCLIGTILTIAIIARALMSWFNPDPRSPLMQALHSVTEPILDPIRRILPRMGIDLSPLIAIVLLQIITATVAQFLDGRL
jgi:YggT family protein